MPLNLKPMIVPLAAAALLCRGRALGSPSPSADSSAYLFGAFLALTGLKLLASEIVTN